MERSNFYYRLVYLSALGLVAVLVFGTSFQITTTTRQMSDDSRVINVAGRQRMLSQRVARDALALANELQSTHQVEGQSAAERLGSDLETWVRSHNGLLERDAELGLSGENSSVVVKLFEDLDPDFKAASASVAELLRLADATQEGKPALAETDQMLIARAIGDAVDRFLPVMNEIVGAYDVESSERVHSLRRSQAWVVGIILVLLVLESLLLFEPMIRRMNRYMAQVEQSAGDAHRANEVKGEFLANMSHEIRTPMAGMLGYIELLKDEGLDRGQKRMFIDSIERNGKHL